MTDAVDLVMKMEKKKKRRHPADHQRGALVSTLVRYLVLGLVSLQVRCLVRALVADFQSRTLCFGLDAAARIRHEQSGCSTSTDHRRLRPASPARRLCRHAGA